MNNDIEILDPKTIEVPEHMLRELIAQNTKLKNVVLKASTFIHLVSNELFNGEPPESLGTSEIIKIGMRLPKIFANLKNSNLGDLVNSIQEVKPYLQVPQNPPLKSLE
jgi:hypothetical protein